MKMTLMSLPYRNNWPKPERYGLYVRLVGHFPTFSNLPNQRFLTMKASSERPFEVLITCTYQSPVSLPAAWIQPEDKANEVWFTNFALPLRRRLDKPLVFRNFRKDSPVVLRLPKHFWPWRLRLWWAFPTRFSNPLREYRTEAYQKGDSK